MHWSGLPPAAAQFERLGVLRHIVRKQALGSFPEVDISPEEYAELKTARAVLSSAFAVEEKYEILVANYLDLEKEMLQLAATSAVRTTLEYSEFFQVRSILNVRLVNLLTAARLYLDQLPQDVGDCMSASAAADRIKERCSREYDEKPEYRFMEALRNHTQHRGIPVHLVRPDARWTSFDENGEMEFTLDIFATRQYLEEDGGFKRSVLNEIGEEVDLKLATRSYVESLSEVHHFARELVADPTAKARSRIEREHERYAKLYDGSLAGLAALAMADDEEVSVVPLLLDWDDVRLVLQKTNSRLVNLRRQYVTGKLKAQQGRKKE
jgi:hypothetical protein